MEDNQYHLVCTSDREEDMNKHKQALAKAGITYTEAENERYDFCVMVTVDTVHELLQIMYAVEEELVFTNDTTIEIYDSYRE